MKTIGSFLVLCLGMVGCAATPPPELVDARVTYARASKSPDAKYAVVDMRDAQLALATAERNFDEQGDSAETRDTAYVAQRSAVAAEAKSHTMSNLDQKKQLEAGLQRQKDEQLANTKGALDSTRKQLARTQDDVKSERSARAAAEKKANDALAAIEGLKAHEDDRGLVLTLSGSVLFKSNSSSLLPTAKSRLAEVATALKEDRRTISVVGHTDSTGGDDLNQRLSTERATAVRTFLEQSGVPTDRMSASGVGKSRPIADNGSPEGRANNRRVEIILQRRR